MRPSENPWKNCLEYCAISEIGLRRSNNQDSHDEVPARNQKIWNQRGHVFCVADGMGAHAAGELASKLATDTIPMVYLKQTQLTPPEALTKAIQEANSKIHAKGNSDEELRGMGTTNDTLVILPEGVMIGHVGDSRVYRLRGNKWDQMTRDHSVVWDKEEAHEVIDDSVHKNVITRCLGVSPDVKPDIEGPWPIQVGDIYLLCSDGLCGQFEEDRETGYCEMGKILTVLPLQEATRALVDLANLRGGPDNITVITVKYLGPQQAVPTTHDPKPVPMAAETEMPHPEMPEWQWSVMKLLGKKPPKAFTQRTGRGPYRSYSAVCDSKFAVELRRIFSELRESAGTQAELNFKKVDQLAGMAAQALGAKNFKDATKYFAQAISEIWRQLAE